MQWQIVDRLHWRCEDHVERYSMDVIVAASKKTVRWTVALDNKVVKKAQTKLHPLDAMKLATDFVTDHVASVKKTKKRKAKTHSRRQN